MKKSKKSKPDQYTYMTETPVQKLILILSIPTIINMLVTNIYNLVDTAFVGRLGNSASGAVGVVFGFMAILQAIGFMFGQGSGSISSRLLGSKDNEKASEVASISFFTALFLGALITIIGLITIDDLVILLGSTPTIAPFAKTYISYILIATPAIICSYVLNNLLRYEGKALLGMIGMLTGAVLNIGGDALFMLGMDLKVHGAGLATCISQYVSFTILLVIFLSGKTSCKLRPSYIPRGIKNLPNIFGTGLPSLLRQGLNSISTVLINRCAAPYGDEAVAAFSIISRISFFTFAISLGLGQGYQPVSAFNYGAKKYSRIREGFRFTFLVSQVVMVVIAGVVILFNQDLIFLFRNDTRVVEIASPALVYLLLSQFALPLCVCTEMQLQTTGKKLGAAFLSSCRSGLFLIPSVLILSIIKGLPGLQIAQPIAIVLTIIPSVFLCRDFFKKLPQETD